MDSPGQTAPSLTRGSWPLAAAALVLTLALLGCGSVPVGKDAGVARDTGTTNTADGGGATDVPSGSVDGDNDSGRPKPADGPGSADGGPFDLGPSAATWDFSNTTWDNSVWN